MSGDLATLRIAVDSTEVQKGTSSLQAMSGVAQDVTRSIGGLTSMVGGLGAAFAAWKVGQYMQDATMLAARYDTLGVAMVQVGKNAGYTKEQLDSYEMSLRKTGISMVESRNNITRLMAAHIDLINAQKLARAAQDVAVVGNLNSSEAFEKMVHGIQSGMVVVLHNMGVMVSFEDAYKRAAKQIGVTTNQLTDQQKAQARLNAVLEFTKTLNGTYEASMTTAGKQMKSMERYAEDLKVKLGEVFQPALTAAVFEIAEGFKQAGQAIDNAKATGEMAKWQDSLRQIAVAGVDLVKFLVSWGPEIIKFGEAWALFKIGTIATDWAFGIQRLIVSKAQLAVASSVERSVAVASAAASYNEALAKNTAAAAAYADTVAKRQNIQATTVLGAADKQLTAALEAEVVAHRAVTVAMEQEAVAARALAAAKSTGGAAGAAGGIAAGAGAGAAGGPIGIAIGVALAALPLLVSAWDYVTGAEEKAKLEAERAGKAIEDAAKKPKPALQSLAEELEAQERKLRALRATTEGGKGEEGGDTRFKKGSDKTRESVAETQRFMSGLIRNSEVAAGRIAFMEDALRKAGDKATGPAWDKYRKDLAEQIRLVGQWAKQYETAESNLTKLADKQAQVDKNSAEIKKREADIQADTEEAKKKAADQYFRRTEMQLEAEKRIIAARKTFTAAQEEAKQIALAEKEAALETLRLRERLSDVKTLGVGRGGAFEAQQMAAIEAEKNQKQDSAREARENKERAAEAQRVAEAEGRAKRIAEALESVNVAEEQGVQKQLEGLDNQMRKARATVDEAYTGMLADAGAFSGMMGGAVDWVKLVEAARTYADAMNRINEAQVKGRAGITKKGEETQATQLLREMDELQKRGGALTFKEQLLAIDRLAEKLGMLPGAVKRAKDQLENEQKMREDWQKGLVAGVRDFGQEATDVYGNLRKASKGWLDQFSATLTQVVMTGKGNFSELARSIMADLANMALKAAIFESIILTLNAISPGAGDAFAASLRSRAIGGGVQAGQPYLVGERGPELFVPQGSGTIMRNGQGGGGGDTITISVQVNAEGSSVEAKGGDEGKMRGLGSQLAGAIRQVILDEKRPGGSLY